MGLLIKLIYNLWTLLHHIKNQTTIGVGWVGGFHAIILTIYGCQQTTVRMSYFVCSLRCLQFALFVLFAVCTVCAVCRLTVRKVWVGIGQPAPTRATNIAARGVVSA